MSHKITTMTEKSFKNADRIARIVFILVLLLTIYNAFAIGIQWEVAEY